MIIFCTFAVRTTDLNLSELLNDERMEIESECQVSNKNILDEKKEYGKH